MKNILYWLNVPKKIDITALNSVVIFQVISFYTLRLKLISKVQSQMSLTFNTATQVAPVPAPMEEKGKHIAVFNVLLDICDAIKGKEGKAVVFLKLLDYASSDALEFTKGHCMFKDVVVNRCYEFKRFNSDMLQLVEKANTVLTKLGLSTIIPTDFTPFRYCSNNRSPVTNTIIQRVEPVVPVSPVQSALSVQSKTMHRYLLRSRR